MWIDDNNFSLTPINFLEIKIPLFYIKEKEGFLAPSLKKKEKFSLPDLSFLLDEEKQIEVFLGWNENALFFYVETFFPYTKTLYPHFSKGDSLEIFVDTRDVKTTGYNTRFCHQFFFLLEPFEGIQAGEITHFRSEERHPFADPALLETKVVFTKKSYQIFGKIPKEALIGYEPENFQRLGFAYRLNRFGEDPLHFGVSGQEYSVEELPSRWVSCTLEK